ncbi:uncharacterized protein BO87DRAFT_243316 [Aspergillus neoniger CBS 115656]|uniref:Uncharacterized protein n=1 Tax=Aspergillus neoniger (strain CBS 115656) TaxID=1448310 RepID=A0A318Y329_ASPNB|nr:hypothetical protein BO87DRAFT_243316 [Aspergillus neoniger CBS 115656]PYH28144.1 hypothetical protein BO87DRAFT_243316 [Aspergillus neoniger CBS 115656]
MLIVIAQLASDTCFRITPYGTTVDKQVMTSSRAVLWTSCNRWLRSRGKCSSMVHFFFYLLYFFLLDLLCTARYIHFLSSCTSLTISFRSTWTGLVSSSNGWQARDWTTNMEEESFRPLRLTNASMILSMEMKAKLEYMHQRTPDGRITMRDHLLHRG